MSVIAVTAAGFFVMGVLMITLHYLQRRKNQSIKREIMAQIDDLNTAITGIQSDVTNLQTDVQTAITDIENAASSQGVDLSGPIAQLQAVHTALQTLATNLSAVEVPATPPTDQLSVPDDGSSPIGGGGH